MKPTDTTRPIRVLFAYVNMATFVRKDLAGLRARFDVTEAPCGAARDMARSLSLVARADCVFCWFGSLRFLPLVLMSRVLHKKVVIVAGGYDVACEPSIGYGNMIGGVVRPLGRLLFRLADRVVAFSRFSFDDAWVHAHVDPRKMEVLYLGFDSQEAPPALAVPKEDLVLTVGYSNVSSIHRKGILAVARVSRLVPEASFVIAGQCDAEAAQILRAEAGPNVRFAGPVSREELTSLFARAKVYVQPSLHEGFGCTVAESMMFGCLPVVSARGSLPEVAGRFGRYVQPTDLAGIASAVRESLSATVPDRESLRHWVLGEFSSARRNARLAAPVEEVCAVPAGSKPGPAIAGQPRTTHRAA